MYNFYLAGRYERRMHLKHLATEIEKELPDWNCGSRWLCGLYDLSLIHI